jgi:hypothetical protein
MILDNRSVMVFTLLFALPACGATDDPFSERRNGVGDADAGEQAAHGGSRAGHDGGTKAGRSGHRGGSDGDDGTSGVGPGEGGGGSDGDDDPDDGMGGAGDPSGGTSSGATGGSCGRAGSGGCGHGVGGAGTAGGGTGGGGGCGHAGSGMGGGGGVGCSGPGGGGCGHGNGGAGMAGSGAGGNGGSSGAPSLIVNAMVYPFSCDHFHPFEVHRVVYESGTPVAAYTCEWTFDGGGSSPSCAGTHEFPGPGFQGGMVTVRDTSTGATATVTTPKILVVDPISLSVTAEAPKCGLSISYVTTKTGGRTGGHTGVLFSPFENVITPGPWPPSGTVEVSAPGTYEVRVLREEETNGPICGAEARATVVVTPCP